MSSISEFRSKVVSGGFAKTARYRVSINSNHSGLIGSFAQNTGFSLEKLQFMCEQAEYPGRTLNVQDIHYYGAGFKSPTVALFNQTSFTFLTSEALDERLFFEKWMDYISGTSDNTGYDMKFKADYATSIDIFQLAETETMEDQGTFQFTLIDAWPMNINPMQISYADDNFHRIMVDFVYTDYSFKQT